MQIGEMSFDEFLNILSKTHPRHVAWETARQQLALRFEQSHPELRQLLQKGIEDSSVGGCLVFRSCSSRHPTKSIVVGVQKSNDYHENVYSCAILDVLGQIIHTSTYLTPQTAVDGIIEEIAYQTRLSKVQLLTKTHRVVIGETHELCLLSPVGSTPSLSDVVIRYDVIDVADFSARQLFN